MTDYYKISLEILYRLLKESGNEHWANWIQKDIHLWSTEQRVDNHLRAYGGMGSINDLSVGGSDTISIWKNRLFERTKNLAWSLATGKISTPPLDDNFYRYGSSEISGWRCKNCGHSRIDKSNIEQYLSAEYLPNVFVDYIKQNKLIEILDLENIVLRKDVSDKRSAIEKQIQNANITLTSGNQWLNTCPKCESKNISGFRWQPIDKETDTIESKDHLKQEAKQMDTDYNVVKKAQRSLWQRLFGSK